MLQEMLLEKLLEKLQVMPLGLEPQQMEVQKLFLQHPNH
jgi:hypothetical protein